MCAVVLNWNGANHTLACLDSLLDGRQRPDLVVVCDNGSTDDSVERIAAHLRERLGSEGLSLLDGPHPRLPETLPAAVLVTNPDNLGYAGGNNAGIRLAMAAGAFDFIWILNNDVIVRPDALPRLLACAANRPQTGIFGVTVLRQGSDSLECAGGCRYNPLTTILTPALAGAPLEEALATDALPRLDYIYGACMFVRREVFRRVGLLHEEYFLYYEELDLCRRATAAGFGLVWCREAVVCHEGGATVARAADADRLATYHETRSTILFTRRFHPGLLPFVAVVRFAGKLAALAIRGRLDLFGPVLAAYRDVLRGR